MSGTCRSIKTLLSWLELESLGWEWNWDARDRKAKPFGPQNDQSGCHTLTSNFNKYLFSDCCRRHRRRSGRLLLIYFGPTDLHRQKNELNFSQSPSKNNKYANLLLFLVFIILFYSIIKWIYDFWLSKELFSSLYCLQSFLPPVCRLRRLTISIRINNLIKKFVILGIT